MLLLRLAGWLSHRPAPLAVVIATGLVRPGWMTSPRGAAWFSRLLEDLRLAGADVIDGSGRAGADQGGPGGRGRSPAP